jgi:hypothetical protein
MDINAITIYNLSSAAVSAAVSQFSLAEGE